MFSKFYHRHSELIGLKTLLQQGISEPIFYGDLVFKFKRIVGKPNFSDQFKKIVKRYIRVGYNLDIMRLDGWLRMGLLPPPREFCRHILSCRKLKAESFKRCLHSVLRGVSL